MLAEDQRCQEKALDKVSTTDIRSFVLVNIVFRGTKPTGPLFASQPDQLIEEIDFEDMDSNDSSTDKKMTDDENPF